MNFKISYQYGAMELKQWELPPVLYTSPPSVVLPHIKTLSDKAERKWWAASTILGQPFA